MPKALFIRGGAIGDFLLTLPAMDLLRRSLPELEIEVLGYRPVVDLALKAGVADRTRSFEHGLYAPLFIPGAAIKPELESWLAGFDLIISYLHDPDDIFATNLKRFTRATLLVGPARIDEASQQHAAQQLAKPLEQLAMWLDSESPILRFAESDNTHPGCIALHPGSGGEHKCWPLERWFTLASNLTRDGDRVVWITGEAEYERGVTERLRREFATTGFEQWHSLPLDELAGRLTTRCAAFVGHDSGITHLANACDLPGVVIFGPTNPTIWRPWQGRFRVIKSPQGDLGQIEVDAVLKELRAGSNAIDRPQPGGSLQQSVFGPSRSFVPPI